MKIFLLPFLVALLAACGGDGAEMDFGGENLGADRFVIHSEDGAVRMGLTDYVVYFTLSDSVLTEARAEMRDSMPRGGIGGAISGMVRGGVERALSFRAKYPLEDIRDIRWENDRMVVELTSGRAFGDSFKVDDRPVDQLFSREDVEAFAAEFRRARRARGGG